MAFFGCFEKAPSYYSDDLLKGIAQGFAIIRAKDVVFDNHLSDKAYIQQQIPDIYEGKDWKTWATFDNYFSLFAETTPKSILTLLENTIKDDSQIIKDIYEQSVTSGTPLYLGILSAMKLLAWSKEYFQKAIWNLIGLEDCTYKKYGNNPLKSLAEIFCPFVVNTSVSLAFRKQVLDNLVKDRKNLDVVFSLLQYIAKMNFATSTNRPKFTAINVEQSIAPEEVGEFYQFIFEKSLSILDMNVERWAEMITNLLTTDLANFDRLIEKLDAIDWEKAGNDFKIAIYQKLDNWIFVNKKLNDEAKEKSGYEQKVLKLTQLLKKIFIDNPVEKNILLFSGRNPYKHDRKPTPELQNAIKEILSDSSIDGIIVFAQRIDKPDIFGYELGYSGLQNGDIVSLLNAEESTNDKIRQMLRVFFLTTVKVKGISILDTIFNPKWDIEYKKLLLCSVISNKSFLDWIEKNELSELYWKNIDNILCDETDEYYETAIKKLSAFGNYVPMLSLMSQKVHSNRLDRIKTSDIVRVLKGIASSEQKTISEPTVDMIHYNIETLFKILQARTDVDEQTLIQLEMMHFELFNEYPELKPIAIDRYFRKNPSFFIEILTTTFLKEPEFKEKTEEEKQRLDNATKIASKLYFRLKKIFPFESEKEFKDWLEGVLPLLDNLSNTDVDMAKIGREKIGNILANAPKDPNDNIWPIKYVRDTIEKLYSDDLMLGIWIAKFNSIGYRFIDQRNPGKDWIELATESKNNADTIRFTYPNTASVLEELADEYERQGKRAKVQYL